MSEASIPIDDPEEIRTLLGARDEHLRRVRDSVGVDVVIRDDALKIQGDRESVDQGVAVIRRLREVIGEAGELRADDVLKALGKVGESISSPDVAASERAGDGDSRTRIELFESAKDVRPKTPGQEAYVNAIRRNDLVFCTGPAGSGKTYLAVAMALSALRSESVSYTHLRAHET